MTCNEVWDETSPKTTTEEQQDDLDFWNEPLVGWKGGHILSLARNKMPHKATAEKDSTDDSF